MVRVGTGPVNQSLSRFDPNATAYGRQSLLRAQVNVSAPSSSLDTGTSLLVPDRTYDAKLQHFFEEIYDLRPESHLSRFLKAMLGDSGVGQLRKRYTIYRLQAAQSSTHFYDLDGFYGALFGAHRNPTEALPLNPLIDTATGVQWDEVHARDTAYRERIAHLARGIALGATVGGIQTAAEAIFGCPCDVYEVWALLDAYHIRYHTPAGQARLWNDMEQDFATYADVEGHTWAGLGSSTGGATSRTWEMNTTDHPTYSDAESFTWAELEVTAPTGVVAVGDSPVPNRAEIIVRPRKQWDSAAEQAADEWSALRVLDVLKPSGTYLSIDPEGVALHVPVTTSGYEADSNYWEVQTRVTPKIGSLANLYPKPVLASSVVGGQVLPRPPFTDVQGNFMTYNTEIVAVQTYAESSPGQAVPGRNADVVTFPDGTTQSYTGDRAVLTAQQVLAARAASEGVLVAAPYSQDRAVAVPHE